MAEEEAWAEYWDGAEGADAVGGGQRHKLAARWAALFASPPPGDPSNALIVDIAAGAGVALAAAIDARRGAGAFLAMDYSAAAVASARKARKEVFGAAADASGLPLANGSADFVISQFGIEYAGGAAFAEAARILAPGGRYFSISHYAGGAIDRECAENERLLQAAVAKDLFDAARATLNASFARRSRRVPAPIDPALDARFAAALGKAGSAAAAAPLSAARATLERFLADLTRLSARRFAFEPAEAIGWIDGMEASLGAYLKRMQSMRASALDRAKIDAVAALFQAAGLAGVKAEPLYLDESKPPAAWVIEAHRPA